MKRLILILCLATLTIASCNTDKKTNAKEDSLAAAAAADSMLNDALRADSLSTASDSVNSDTDSL
jgi:hypothetical protein